MSSRRLTSGEVSGLGLADWRILFSALHARFRTGDFATGLRLVDAIGAEAEAMDHHPDLDLRYAALDVRLTSHDTGGVTDRDVRLARTISALAERAGVPADPQSLQVLEIALDAADTARVRPFWAAVLGLEATAADDELVDPHDRLPTMWFQPTTPHVEPRQRFHLDVRVPPEVAPARVRAALDAGGTLVSDADAPTYWVLADPEGNKACVCTWQGRSH